jgi:hypothetical protein
VLDGSQRDTRIIAQSFGKPSISVAHGDADHLFSQDRLLAALRQPS